MTPSCARCVTRPRPTCRPRLTSSCRRALGPGPGQVTWRLRPLRPRPPRPRHLPRRLHRLQAPPSRSPLRRLSPLPRPRGRPSRPLPPSLPPKRQPLRPRRSPPGTRLRPSPLRLAGAPPPPCTPPPLPRRPCPVSAAWPRPPKGSRTPQRRTSPATPARRASGPPPARRTSRRQGTAWGRPRSSQATWPSSSRLRRTSCSDCPCSARAAPPSPRVPSRASPRSRCHPSRRSCALSTGSGSRP
mmetsp:Transcript_24591/g.92945  ORF Transcript_24591/g.92945 Transcript_24591/m.92945 type:complete len:243 (+) Transcript_24591:3966-4694(+)